MTFEPKKKNKQKKPKKLQNLEKSPKKSQQNQKVWPRFSTKKKTNDF